MNTTQLGTVAEKWLKRYVEGSEKGKPREIANDGRMEYIRGNRGSGQPSLGMRPGNSSSQLQTIK